MEPRIPFDRLPWDLLFGTLTCVPMDYMVEDLGGGVVEYSWSPDDDSSLIYAQILDYRRVTDREVDFTFLLSGCDVQYSRDIRVCVSSQQIAQYAGEMLAIAKRCAGEPV